MQGAFKIFNILWAHDALSRATISILNLPQETDCFTLQYHKPLTLVNLTYLLITYFAAVKFFNWLFVIGRQNLTS